MTSTTGQLAGHVRDKEAARGDLHTYSVYELNHRVQQALYRHFPTEVWVQGEITGLARSRGRPNTYFELVEKDQRSSDMRATLPVVLFGANRPRIEADCHGDEFRLEDGLEVRIRGRVDVFRARAKLQLVMTGIDTSYTLGRLARQREIVLARLCRDGLADRNSRLVLSAVPLQVGLVTSEQGAAFVDFVHELERSGFGFKIVFVDTPVQGTSAERRLVAAVHALARHAVDVIAIIRGGGARSELALFDSELLARAIAMVPVPVFVGVGHEIDTSVADLVAHTSVKTPTACAAMLVERVTSFLAELAVRSGEIFSATQRELRSAVLDVEQISTSVRHDALHAMGDSERRLDHAATRIGLSAQNALTGADVRLAAVSRCLGATNGALRRLVVDIDATYDRVQDAALKGLCRAEAETEAVAAHVRSADPARILGRGWALVRSLDGTIITSAAQLSVGMAIDVELRDGHAEATVNAVSGVSSLAEVQRAHSEGQAVKNGTIQEQTVVRGSL